MLIPIICPCCSHSGAIAMSRLPAELTCSQCGDRHLVHSPAEQQRHAAPKSVVPLDQTQQRRAAKIERIRRAKAATSRLARRQRQRLRPRERAAALFQT
jgi:hypothetical protein